MLENAIFALLGIVSSWYCSTLYYRKASKDQRQLLAKLPEDIRQALQTDHREKLTVEELNSLLRERVIDDSSLDELPYKCCPKCGSINLVRRNEFFNADVNSGDDGEAVYTPVFIPFIRCFDCNWYDNGDVNKVAAYK